MKILCTTILWFGLLVTTTLSADPAGVSVEVAWRFTPRGPIFGSPSLDGGTIYVGSLDSTFYAIDLLSGKERWHFVTGGEIRSTALVDASAVYFVSGDGSLYSLDKTNGQKRWSFAMEREVKFDFADYYQSSPRLHNGVLYVGSGDGHIYAIEASTGSPVWQFPTGGPVHATPALSKDKLFVGSFDGYFYALNALSGDMLWKFKSVGHRYFPNGEFMGTPAVGMDLVYVGARDYNLYALDQDSGFCHWNKSFVRGWALSNTVRDSVLFTGTSDDRLLIASGVRSGREFWKTNLGFNIFGGLAFDDSLGYIGTLIGKLHAVNLITGQLLWSFATDGYTRNHAKYFKADDSFRDDIFEIVKSDEAFIDVEYEIGAIFSTPVISGNHILVTSTDGTVYCLNKPR